MNFTNEIQMEVPTFILTNNLLFPDTELVINVSKEQAEQIKKCVFEKEILIAVFGKKQDIQPKALMQQDDVYPVGCIGRVVSILPYSNNVTQIKIVSLNIKVELMGLSTKKDFLSLYFSKIKFLDKKEVYTDFTDEYINQCKVILKEIRNAIVQIDEVERYQDFDQLLNLSTYNQVQNLENQSYMLGYILPFSIKEKQELLAIDDTKDRLTKVLYFLHYQSNSLNEISEIKRKTLENLQNEHKKQILKEFIKTAKKDIGDEEKTTETFSEKMKKAKFPKEIKDIANEELARMEQLPQTSSDYHVIRNYLEWLLALPWSKNTKDTIDLAKAKKILDEEHFGLEKVKKKILEFLAISSLKGSFKGQILCLAGPPGVGKTSLAKSIAKAVGRKYVRMSLGGVHDESEIRGHRKTYVGAMPGKIVQNLKKAESMNPLFLLDEIDKLGKSAHGDPSAALLEVLDPEQNTGFLDNFINAPIDLSGILFITTANSLEDIPGPLRDRMDIINLGSYTHNEKHYIVKKHLIPKMLKEYILTKENISFTDEAINKIINDYTREAGVRDLQRKVGQICQFLAQEVVEKTLQNTVVDENKVREVLGKETVKHEKKLDSGEIGIASGLAWTSVGGEMLFIESNSMPGHGKLILTGSLGDVMKESANIALSYIKANKKALNIDFDFDKNDIHLHFPSGAVPKDGPSAGIAICSCLISLFNNKKFPHNVAMTGEISLRGNVLPVGGIKEKVLAAHRAGITTVYLPKENEANADEIPQEVLNDLSIVYVEKYNEVFDGLLK